MADALTGAGLIYSNRTLAAGITERLTGILIPYGMSLRAQINASNGLIIMNAFVLEQDIASGAFTSRVISYCQVVTGGSWNDIYTPASGKSAFVALVVTNIDTNAHQYSVGIAGVTEVIGG